MRFRLIDQAKKEFPVHRLCKVLDVSQSGYFAWKIVPPVAGSAMTWCFWRMSVLPSRCRMEPMAARE